MGLLLHWMVLELCMDVAHAHIACWYDNTPTIAWASKLLSTKATMAVQLLWILALQMLHCWASPLTMLHAPCCRRHEYNSRFCIAIVQRFLMPNHFLTEFHNHFPLLQDTSWNLFQLPNAAIGCICALLSTKTPMLESWHRLAQQGSIIGGIGKNFFPAISIHTFKKWIKTGKSPSYNFLLDGSGKVQQEGDDKSKPVACKQHLVPLARLSNWLGLKTHCTELELTSTMPPLLCKQKHTNELTQ